LGWGIVADHPGVAVEGGVEAGLVGEPFDAAMLGCGVFEVKEMFAVVAQTERDRFVRYREFTIR